MLAVERCVTKAAVGALARRFGSHVSPGALGPRKPAVEGPGGRGGRGRAGTESALFPPTEIFLR